MSGMTLESLWRDLKQLIDNVHERILLLEWSQKEMAEHRKTQELQMQKMNDILGKTSNSLLELVGKFNSLLHMFKIGFIIMSAGFTLFVTVISAYFAYENSLDRRYQRNYVQSYERSVK